MTTQPATATKRTSIGDVARRSGMAGLMCVAVMAPVSIASTAAPSNAAPTKPNIVIILSDDQPKGMLATMPQFRSQVVPVATSYTKAVVPTSVCCPSRTSLLTGLYSNQTGVFGVTPAKYGGYEVFEARGNQNRTIAVKLQEDGYATGLFGKYLNGYQPTSGTPRPPGWNRWNTITEGQPGGNKYTKYEYTSDSPEAKVPETQNPDLETPDPTPPDVTPPDATPPELALEDTLDAPTYVHSGEGMYSTTQMGAATSDFIDEVPADQPLFAMYTPYAPHSPFIAEPKYAGTGIYPSWTKPPGDEKNRDDKPKWVRKQPKKLKLDHTNPRTVWRAQTATLRSVDDQVADIIATLKRTGRWDNTLLVYTSDNGYAYGQNHVTAKNNPYRAASEVDLFVRYPGQESSRTNSNLVTPNIDVAATVLSQAGVANSTSGLPLELTGDRSGIPMMGSSAKLRNRQRPPYCGWRTPTELFIRYGSKEEEYYDYATDPGGKSNLLRPPLNPKKVKPRKKFRKLERARLRDAQRAIALREKATLACTDLTPDFGPSFSKPTWKYKY